MSKEYPFPMVVQDNKRLSLRYHVATYSGYSVNIINRFIETGDIATYLVGLQVYIDIDETLTVLAKSKYHPKKAERASSKILHAQQIADLFGPKVA